MKKINLGDKFKILNELWVPKIVGELNGQYVKVIKLKGEFVWHQHAAEDELFLVLKGQLTIKFRDRDVILEEGELMVVPRGVEHKTVAEEEVHVLLFEPQSLVNTGNVREPRTINSAELEKI